ARIVTQSGAAAAAQALGGDARLACRDGRAAARRSACSRPSVRSLTVRRQPLHAHRRATTASSPWLYEWRRRARRLLPGAGLHDPGRQLSSAVRADRRPAQPNGDATMSTTLRLFDLFGEPDVDAVAAVWSQRVQSTTGFSADWPPPDLVDWLAA